MKARAPVAVLIALALLLPACGIAERKRRADALIAAPGAAARSGSAQVTLVTTLLPKEVRGRTDVRVAVLPPMRGSADFAAGRSTLSPVGPDLKLGANLPSAQGVEGGYARLAQGRVGFVDTERLTYAGTNVFAVRETKGLVSHRNWIELKIRDLRLSAGDLVAVGFPTIGPPLIVDLLRGALAGSVKRRGSAEMSGVRVTHYAVNLDREKAFRKVRSRKRDAIDKAFEAMGAKKLVYPAEVWLDDAGRPRRVMVRIEQRVSRTTSFEIGLALDVRRYTKDATISLPPREAIANVDGVGELLANLGA